MVGGIVIIIIISEFSKMERLEDDSQSVAGKNEWPMFMEIKAL